jgi:hypothetical protein
MSRVCATMPGVPQAVKRSLGRPTVCGLLTINFVGGHQGSFFARAIRADLHAPARLRRCLGMKIAACEVCR